MKILYLCHSLNMGGIEKNLVLLTEEIHKTSSRVFVGAKPGVVQPMLEEQGATCIALNSNIRSPFTLLSDAKKIATLCQHEDIDLIHTFSAAPAVACWLAKLGCKLRMKKFPVTVSSIMGLQESSNEKALVTHLRNFLTVLGAKRIFIISPMIKQFVSKLPIRKSRMKELHLVGVKLPAKSNIPRAQLKKELGITTKKLVVTIGHLSPRKNHELFIKAAAEVLKTEEDATFLVVGDGPDRAALEQAIKTTGMTSNIRLFGLCKEIYKLLAITDVCVKPGIVEGFIGITVLEAQAMGVPVVAFDTVDVGLAIEDQKTGLIAHNANPHDLARKISALLNDSKKAKIIGRNGKQNVEKSWAIDVLAQNLLAEYQTLIIAN